MGEALSLVIGGLNHEHALIFAATSVLLQVFVRYRRYAPALSSGFLLLSSQVASNVFDRRVLCEFLSLSVIRDINI